MTYRADLAKVEEFVRGEKFINFLLNNLNDFGNAVFIILTVLNEIEHNTKVTVEIKVSEKGEY